MFPAFEPAQCAYDVELLRSALDEVLERHPPQVSERGTTALRSLSLTHRAGAADPVYDGNNSQFGADGQRLYEESDFDTFNEGFRDTYFYEVYRTVPFRVGRMRLIVLPPLTVYKMHRDSARRAHLALRTNSECFLVLESGEARHIEADGTCHLVDTTRPHTAFNASDEHRWHLTMSVVEPVPAAPSRG